MSKGFKRWYRHHVTWPSIWHRTQHMYLMCCISLVTEADGVAITEVNAGERGDRYLGGYIHSTVVTCVASYSTASIRLNTYSALTYTPPWLVCWIRSLTPPCVWVVLFTDKKAKWILHTELVVRLVNSQFTILPGRFWKLLNMTYSVTIVHH